jgi:hypothetical protein
MTIQQQYNTELNRIWDEITKFDHPNLARLFKNLDVALENKTWLIYKTLTAKDEKAMEELAQAIQESEGMVKPEDIFLFPEGQRENPQFSLITHPLDIRSQDFTNYSAYCQFMDDYYNFYDNYPKTLSQIFLANCLLTGDDEVDQERINNLKKVKFV